MLRKRGGNNKKHCTRHRYRGDPDDIFAHLYIMSREDVVLKAVTLAPGRHCQVELVSRIALVCGQDDIRIGMPFMDKIAGKHVNQFHYKFLNVAEVPHDGDRMCIPDVSTDILGDAFAADPETLLIIIGPLTNVDLLIRKHLGVRIDRSYSMEGVFMRTSRVFPFR